MKLDDFLRIIEDLTDSPVRISRIRDIPSELEAIEIDGIRDTEKRLLKESYCLDERRNKYYLKTDLPIENKKRVLELFGRLDRNKAKLDESLIAEVISDETRRFDWSQFNELLLLCNKDRVNEGFFDFFLRKRKDSPESITLKDIKEMVQRFRKYAMLAYGNFRFAYRELSRMKYEEIESELSDYVRDPDEVIKAYELRPEKVQDIEKIDEKDTYLVGYLSEGNIELDLLSSKQLKEFLGKFHGKTWSELKSHVEKSLESSLRNVKDELRDSVRKRISIIIGNFEKDRSKDIDEFRFFLHNSALEIEDLEKHRSEVQSQARKNNQVYLTWDHMDVYLATSMRTKWEYEQFCKLVRAIFEENADIKGLNIRYFNPVQCYEKSSVDKGLVEGLMLKRAKCTIYSVQETDTLGKDSELATTLVQGKPVVAFVKQIPNIRERANELKKMQLEFFEDRVKLLAKENMFTEEKVMKDCEAWIKKQSKKIREFLKDPKEFADEFTDKIIELIRRKAWGSIVTPWINEEAFKKQNRENFKYYCTLIAIAERHFYDKRADMLSTHHPLRLQIDLKTGVANGVLVVRSYEQCAKLLKNILTNKIFFDLQFDLCYNKNEGSWVLEEKISKCIFRAVTDNIRVTNSFWNFYLEKEKGS